MAESPTGAFPHQHSDPRDLRERIDAQLRDRIAEAVDMFALTAVVEGRRRQGRAAPDTDRAEDRRELEETALALLAHLRQALDPSLTAEQREAIARAEASAADGRERLLASQVSLARLLPDYWQRFERLAASAPGADGPSDERRGWLGRLFSSGARDRGGRPRPE